MQELWRKDITTMLQPAFLFRFIEGSRVVTRTVIKHQLFNALISERDIQCRQVTRLGLQDDIHRRAVGIADMAGPCKQHMNWLYLDVKPKNLAEALSAGLGKQVSGDDLMWASLQLRTLERAIECAWGRRREHDTIPEKEFGRKGARGCPEYTDNCTTREDLEAMKDEYYWYRGWDKETGIPYAETLHDFGLDDVAKQLDVLGILPRSQDEKARREGIAIASTMGYVWPEHGGRDNPAGNKAPWAQEETVEEEETEQRRSKVAVSDEG